MAKHSSQRANNDRANMLNPNNAAYVAAANNRSDTFNPTSKTFEAVQNNAAKQVLANQPTKPGQ